MADLRILEEQQYESVQKLDTARLTKQRRMQQQTNLEQRLDELKYSNGLKRSELSSFHNALSDGQRHLHGSRSMSGRAGENLQEFNRKLKRFLEIKPKLLWHEFKQDQILENLCKYRHRLKSLVLNAEQDVDQEKTALEASKNREISLRNSIYERNCKQQDIAQHMVLARSCYSQRDQSLSDMHSEESCLQLELESNTKTYEARFSHYEETLSNLQSKVDGASGAREEYFATKVALNKELEKLKQSLSTVKGETRVLQVSDGHLCEADTWEANGSLLLDVQKVQMSLIDAQKSSEEESKAKIVLQDSIKKCKLQLAQMLLDLETEAKKAFNLEDVVFQSDKKEHQRDVSYSELFRELGELKMVVDKKHLTLQDYHFKHGSVLKASNDILAKLLEENIVRRHGINSKDLERKELESRIDGVQVFYKDAKISDGQKIKNGHHSVSDLRCQFGVLLKTLDKENASAKPKSRHSNFHVKCNQIKQEITAILEGKFLKVFDVRCIIYFLRRNIVANPLLQDLAGSGNDNYNYSPSKDMTLQALSDICMKRIESAKKMKIALQESERKAVAESKRIKRAAAAQEKSKEEARERRRNRHLVDNLAILSTSSKNIESNDDVSEAKPRFLLQSFSKATVETENRVSSRDGKRKYSDSNAMMEKKVRWEDKNASELKGIGIGISRNSNGNTEKSQISKKRRTFGTVIELNQIDNQMKSRPKKPNKDSRRDLDKAKTTMIGSDNKENCSELLGFGLDSPIGELKELSSRSRTLCQSSIDITNVQQENLFMSKKMRQKSQTVYEKENCQSKDFRKKDSLQDFKPISPESYSKRNCKNSEPHQSSRNDREYVKEKHGDRANSGKRLGRHNEDAEKSRSAKQSQEAKTTGLDDFKFSKSAPSKSKKSKQDFQVVPLEQAVKQMKQCDPTVVSQKKIFDGENKNQPQETKTTGLDDFKISKSSTSKSNKSKQCVPVVPLEQAVMQMKQRDQTALSQKKVFGGENKNQSQENKTTGLDDFSSKSAPSKSKKSKQGDQLFPLEQAVKQLKQRDQTAVSQKKVFGGENKNRRPFQDETKNIRTAVPDELQVKSKTSRKNANASSKGNNKEQPEQPSMHGSRHKTRDTVVVKIAATQDPNSSQAVKSNRVKEAGLSTVALVGARKRRRRENIIGRGHHIEHEQKGRKKLTTGNGSQRSKLEDLGRDVEYNFF